MKNVHPVYSAGILTHVIMNMSLLPEPLDHGSRPTYLLTTFLLISGEMFMSLLWYYRPEHIDSGRRSDDLQDEIYASRHRDFTSVACIEDKCYVMTFNEYCRFERLLL